MRYSFIQAHKDTWPVTVMADLLDVSTAGFYAWRDRPPSDRQNRRDELLVQIHAIHERVKGRYGSPRIHVELKADGHDWSVNTVAEVMRQAGIRAKTARKFRDFLESKPKVGVGADKRGVSYRHKAEASPPA